MGKAAWIFILLFFSFFISCGQQGNILMNSEEEYFLFTIDEGSMISSGSDIPVRYSGEEGEADRVVIRLADRALTELAVVEVLPEELGGEGLPLSLPEDLEQDVYLLQFEVWGGDVLLSESEVYFYLVDGEYDFLGIETYPPSAGPGSYIRARASLEYPENSEPWLRWILDDQILFEGFVSEIGLIYSFTVPDEEGVYSLKGELFPLEPDADYISSVNAHTDLFVSMAADDETDDSDPVFSILNLPFDGEGADTLGEGYSVELFGLPEPVSGDRAGFSFTADDGLFCPDVVLSLNRDTELKGFSLNLDFKYENLPVYGRWRILSLGSTQSGFSLVYDGSGGFFSAVPNQGGVSYVSIPVSVFPDTGDVSLTLVYSNENGVDGKSRISCLLQGELLAETEAPYFSDINLEGFFIGSNGEIAGLPLIWKGVDLAVLLGGPSPAENPQIDSGESLSSQVLYTRGDVIPEEISVSETVLGEGFATLEILLDEEVPAGSWEFVFLNDDESFIEFEPVFRISEETETDETYPALITLSLVNNGNGFFMSYANQVKGPFPSINSLKFKIVPYNSFKSGLDAVKEILLYQD